MNFLLQKFLTDNLYEEHFSKHHYNSVTMLIEKNFISAESV